MKKKNSNKININKTFEKIINILENATDSELIEIINQGFIDKFLRAIAKPKENTNQFIYDYLLENKQRLAILSLIRFAITHNYSIKAKVNNEKCFVSPEFRQWFDDGVMFLQGGKPFSGLIGLYQNGEIKFATAARDVIPGEQLGPKDFIFSNIEYVKKAIEQNQPIENLNILEEALSELSDILMSKNNDESQYQSFLERNPWVFGGQYSRIQSHKSLDDENIPDFTGIRTRDGARDVIEIKQPFLCLFKKDGSFRQEFNDAFNKAEQYLDFAKREIGYLSRQKRLIFNNPYCYLIIGYNLNKEKLQMLRRKERMNPNIIILTYNDLLRMAKSTVLFIKRLN